MKKKKEEDQIEKEEDQIEKKEKERKEEGGQDRQ
jgi:hypothetical protein